MQTFVYFTVRCIKRNTAANATQSDSMKEVQNKVIFITGAGNGIGFDLAKTLYRLQAKLIVGDIDTAKLNELTASWDKARYLQLSLDVASKASWQQGIAAALTKFNRIDMLINAAGIIEPGYIHETTLDAIDRQIDINLKGTMYGSHLIAVHMKQQQSGHIINFGSLASLAPVPGLNCYSASKFGVRGFSLAIAEELEEHHIQVSVICPDAVQTPMLDYQKDKPEAALTFSGNKFLTVEEVTQAVLEQAIKLKQRDIWIPKHRGAIALSGSVFPGIAHTLKLFFLKRGLANQSKYKR